MPAFVPAIVQGEIHVANRLADFGIVPSQLMAVGKAARTWADDASPLMPINAPGTLAYIMGFENCGSSCSMGCGRSIGRAASKQ